MERKVEPGPGPGPGDLVPRPDPTILTTRQLQTAIDALREVVFTRLDAMDRARELIAEMALRIPSEVDKEVSHLRNLTFERIDSLMSVSNERFGGVTKQFAERDVRVEQTARDTKVAVDAALAAQKEMANQQTIAFAQSISKSEAATSKQIDQLGQLLSTTNTATDGKIGDIKERLTRLEGEGKGERAAVVTQQTSNMNIVSVVGLIVGTLIGVAGIVAALIASSNGP